MTRFAAERHGFGIFVSLVTSKRARGKEEKRYQQEYGELYEEAIARVRAAQGKPITSLFELPKKSGRIKTEILFIERCPSRSRTLTELIDFVR